ncbi:unnamed protein product [Gongylonema pulchrum]|uniref:DH domain-containing protein n=1 Tax=Gongylonema pulchrum TaxID=637853 RepID=A0A183D8F7_9BILA|nr:unnamed protein product [Gongylonema pulchrum]
MLLLHTVSPYEFYGRPLKIIRKLPDRYVRSGVSSDAAEELVDEEFQAMLSALKEFSDFADELNLFYGLRENRKKIDFSRVFVDFFIVR